MVRWRLRWHGENVLKMGHMGEFIRMTRRIGNEQQYFVLYRDGSIASSRIPLLAAVAGSMVTRTASKRAFLKNGRGKFAWFCNIRRVSDRVLGVVTQDMLPEVGGAFEEVFGSEGEKEWAGNTEGKL